MSLNIGSKISCTFLRQFTLVLPPARGRKGRTGTPARFQLHSGTLPQPLELSPLVPRDPPASGRVRLRQQFFVQYLKAFNFR